MKTSLNGRVAVITGGGGGIGSAAAKALAEEGVRIALCGGRNREKLAAAAAAVKERGARVLTLPGDLTDPDFLGSCIGRAADRFGGIDILINSAGTALSKPFEETTPDDLDRIFAVNVKAPFLLCQKALPYLYRSDRAEIVNISSVVGHKGYVRQAAYAASKHAVLGFSKSLANEVYARNVRVHTICPGSVYTDMIKTVRPDLTGEDMISPDEIAGILLFLLQNRGNAVIDEICVHRPGKPPFDF